MEGVNVGIGKMNSTANIISRSIGKDSEGFKAETETVKATCHCWHETRHSSRRWLNLAAFSTATDRFVLRIIPELTVVPGWFLECGGVRYKILSAENIRGRDMYLEIYAERVESSLG